MFLNKRKLIFLLILFGIVTTSLFAQQSDKTQAKILLDYKELILDGKKVYLPIYKVNKQYLQYLITQYKEEDVIHKEIITSVYNENWNTKIFNTFLKKKFDKRPFLLHFKDSVFSSPVDHKMVVTSRYGWRRGRAHQGIDIDLRTGDNVKALLSGKVRYARRHSGHGKTVVIRHENGLETVYAHLSEYAVKENDLVEKGQVIGKGGISGNARGSHLHLEVRYQGKSIHPEYLFDFSENTKVRAEQIAVTKKWMTPRSHRSTRKSKIVIQQTIEKITEEPTTRSVYVVQKGDTLYGIAKKHDIDVSEICKINEIRYNSVLNIGQEIVIF